ncbi:Rho GTPase activating protein [Lecanora helva]
MGMDMREQITALPNTSAASPAHDLSEKRQGVSTKSFDDGPTTSRKLPPLQVSETTSIASGRVSQAESRSPKSPTIMRIAGESQPSPRSPRSNLAGSPARPGSPRDEHSGMGNTHVGGPTNSVDSSMRRVTASPPKASSYSQLRGVSSPLLQATQAGNSSPPSPRSTTSPASAAIMSRPESRPMPRTSSIDSAISNVSLSTIHSHRPSQDSGSGQPDVSHLIQTAGSAEAVIQHLLKEKQHSAAQNVQLWKLVDKQRSLLLGLNQDLEKALRDKEKYRKKLKEHLEKVPPVPSSTPKASRSQPVTQSRSPTPSEDSTDLPIQGQSQERTVAPESPVQIAQTLSDIRAPPTNDEDNWVRNKSKTQEPKHSHKTTSSSDVGVFSPIRPMPTVTPIQTSVPHTTSHKCDRGSPSQASPSAEPVVSPTNSFTAKRSQPQSSKAFNGPALSLTESTPTRNDVERMTPPRKAPPAPLDLGQPKRETPTQSAFEPEDHSESEYDDDVEVDELPAFERGRKKTREDDDREREAVLRKQTEERSRSAKEKKSKSRTNSAKSRSQEQGRALEPEPVPFTPSIKAFSPDPNPLGASTLLSPPTSLASVLSPPETQNDSITRERVLLAKPMSPGLPLSPRPNHRPMNPPTPRLPRDGAGPSIASPPVSPKNAFVGLPLSPRAPRQPIPLPPHTPVSLMSPRPLHTDSRTDTEEIDEGQHSSARTPLVSEQTYRDRSSPKENDDSLRSRGIFKGFVSEVYPDLLLPPNALPSILVTVISSRLKPSRHSLVMKGSDEEPVFILGISARSNRQALWQLEKPLQSLQQLDQQLRQSSAITVKHPDRSLFNGHAPAKVDARRIALEGYFEAVLDTPMDERAALILCRYLSTQVSEPSSDQFNDPLVTSGAGSPVTYDSHRRLAKEGYLTKRGKNFGGWKARFFILDEPILRYYETPGGSLLGTIKLHNAQIGKQNNKPSHSPSRSDEADGSYRHAFLIREPKRKDSSSFIDHVLCAESDNERDAWVAALVCYVELPGDANSKPVLTKNESGSHSMTLPANKNSLKKEILSTESPDSETFESLQAVPYENTQAARAPLVQITPDPRPADSPSPTMSGSQSSAKVSPAQSKAISGPQNGAKISDVGAWGNKPMASPLNFAKEQKKRSIWGFRDRNAADIAPSHSNDSDLSLTQRQYQEQITNVKAAFGATLLEAVEYCGPRGMDACLPAVVYRCLEYLEMKNAASEEGIFRMSGSNTLIKGLRSRFNAEGDFDLLGDDEPYYDVHAIASLLKLYLRELPEPVLTKNLHFQFLNVLEYPDKSTKITAFNALVHQLPKPNFTLLRALSSFLITVVSNYEINKMSIRNVGIVFSPTLNIPAPVFSMFLTDFDAIFGEKPEDAAVPIVERAPEETLTPEDIRSPRRQMFSDIPTPSYNQDTFSEDGSTAIRPQTSTPEHALHGSYVNGDTGFVPLQPSYSSPAPEHEPITVPGPEYAVARPRNLAPGGPAKTRRRESSMLLM